MNRKDFIDEVMHFIVDKRNRPLIVEELNNHIDDRIERYLEQGFSQDEAEELAVKRMGSAQVIGNQMSALYDKKARTSQTITLLILVAIYIFEAFMTKPDCLLDFRFLSEECLIILGIGAMYFNSIRYRSEIMAVTSFLMSLLSCGYVLWVNTGKFVSSLVIFLSYGLKGELSTIIGLSNASAKVIAGNKFVILSVLLYVLIFVITLINLVLVLRSKTDRFTKKEMKAQKGAQIVCGIILFVALVIDITGLVLVLQDEGNRDYTYAVVYSDDKSTTHYSDNYFDEYTTYGWLDSDYQRYFDNATVSVTEKTVEIDDDLSFVKRRYELNISDTYDMNYVSLATLKYKSDWVHEGEDEYDQLAITDWQSTDNFEFVEDTGYAEYVFHD